MSPEISRRPLKSRSAKWPRDLSALLVRRGLSPNQISVTSAAVSLLGASFLFFSPRHPGAIEAVHFLAAAVCIQLRLLCNLLDGLMAVEGGLKTKSGEIFNEFPDRLADVSLLIAAGYSIRFNCSGAIELGYLGAVVSVATAYVRVFGGSAGLPQDFCGPMAKQQRMATLTIACVLSAAEALMHWQHRVMFLSLVVILIGSLVTIARRTRRIAKILNAR